MKQNSKVITKLSENELKQLASIKGGMSNFIENYEIDLTITSSNYRCLGSCRNIINPEVTENTTTNVST